MAGKVLKLPRKDLGKITVDDLYLFLDYLNLYTAPDNDENLLKTMNVERRVRLPVCALFLSTIIEKAY